MPFARITLVQGDTALTPDQGTTWGSLSIQVGGMQIRNAAATAQRARCSTRPAKRLGAKTDELTVADGVISGGGKSVTYGAADRRQDRSRSSSIRRSRRRPRIPKDYKVVGKSVPRVDIPDKVTGRFTYMQDFRVPGMLHGRVVRPPAIGAKLESVDESSVKDIPGLVKVVREGNFLGVVARSEWARHQGGARAQGHMVEMGRPARAGQALWSMCARPRSPRTR